MATMNVLRVLVLALAMLAASIGVYFSGRSARTGQFSDAWFAVASYVLAVFILTLLIGHAS